MTPDARNTHWGEAVDIKPGQYFKHYGRWHLAIRAPIQAASEMWAASHGTHAIQAYDVNGHVVWVGFTPGLQDEAMMIIADEGKRPTPFTPATLRRKARAHYETASRERYAAAVKETLAQRIETGTANW